MEYQRQDEIGRRPALAERPWCVLRPTGGSGSELPALPATESSAGSGSVRRLLRARAALVLVVGVGTLDIGAGQALAQGPGPEPAPVTRGAGLRPEPTPTGAPAKQGPPATARYSRAVAPPPAISLPTTRSSADNPQRTPPRAHSAGSRPRVTAPTTRTRRANGTRRPAADFLAASRSAAARVFLFLTIPTRALAQRSSRSTTRPDSTFLLIGGLALTVLVLGETAFLTLLGVRPSRSRRYEGMPPARAIRDLPFER